MRSRVFDTRSDRRGRPGTASPSAALASSSTSLPSSLSSLATSISGLFVSSAKGFAATTPSERDSPPPRLLLHHHRQHRQQALLTNGAQAPRSKTPSPPKQRRGLNRRPQTGSPCPIVRARSPRHVAAAASRRSTRCAAPTPPPCDVMGVQVRRSSFNYICNAICGEGVLKIRRDE